MTTDNTTRAYWRLLPAGLAVQTCIRFGLALMRSPPPAASAALGFALASFSVGIIAVILVRDLFVRTFSWSAASNRQYVATDRSSEFFAAQSSTDSMLLYVDLGSVAAAKWTLTNLGNVLRLLVRHGFQSLEIAVRWVFRHGRRCVELFYTWVVSTCNSPLLAIPAVSGESATVFVCRFCPLRDGSRRSYS